MIQHRTLDLDGPALDYAVAMAELRREDYRDRGLLIHRIGYGQPMPAFSSDENLGAEIIEREGIRTRGIDGGFHAWHPANPDQKVFGTRQLTAAMRCYVLNRFGHTVSMPAAQSHRTEVIPEEIDSLTDRPNGG